MAMRNRFMSRGSILDKTGMRNINVTITKDESGKLVGLPLTSSLIN